MSLQIAFRPSAKAELNSAVDWYEQQRSGLGADFAIAVDCVLAKAADQPDFYPPVWSSTREGSVRGFPYCVYYREEPGRILIGAVIHNARDPKIWQRRF